MSSKQLILIMRETLPYIWWKHNIQQLPQEHLVEDTLEGVRRAVHVETFLSSQAWEPYLRKHFRRMCADQKSFGRFTAFACYMEFNALKNPFERYIRILALGAYFALYCYTRGKPYGVAVLPVILERFINTEMSDLIVDKEFLTSFGNHIIRKDYLPHYLELDRMHREGRSRQEILKAVAKNSTINNLGKNAIEWEKVDGDYIQEYELMDEIIRSLNKIVYTPEPRKPLLKMSLDQKHNVASKLTDDLHIISMKMFGLDRLMVRANDDLEYKLNFREGLLQAPLMDEIPEGLVLDCLLNLCDFL